MQIKKKSASKAKAKPKTLKKSGEPLPKKKLATKKALASKVPTKVIVPPEFTMKQVKEIVALIKDAGAFTTFGYKTEEFEIEIGEKDIEEDVRPGIKSVKIYLDRK